MDELKVTPALLIALFQKPHDRGFLIELENSILDFVDSSAYTYQLKPMNSYYRLLSHQVAEYHGLQHTVSKDNDKCVIVYKQNDYEPNSGLILLQQLEPQVMYQFPPEYYALASMAAANNQQQQMMQKGVRQKTRASSNNGPNQRNASNFTPPESSSSDLPTVGTSSESLGIDPSTQPKKKVTILKREVDSNSSDEAQEKQSSTEAEQESSMKAPETFIDLEEQRRLKEEEYNKEKERIFADSPSSLSPVSTPPITPTELSSGNALLGKDNDSPQPHQFETSRYKLNNQNEMKYMKKNQYQNYNKRQPSHYYNNHTHYNGYNNGNKYNTAHNRQTAHMQQYYRMAPPMAPMNAGAIPYGYPMMAPMEYMYYPMGAPLPNNQMMMPGQAMYGMPPPPPQPVYQPYERKNGNKNDSNGSKKSGNPN